MQSDEEWEKASNHIFFCDGLILDEIDELERRRTKIAKLEKRYTIGERTQELYDAMMGVE